MKILLGLVALCGLALLVGCGTDERDRTEGGAAAGAATGAGIGLVGGPVGVVAGGLIGGGAGAIAGATTQPKDVNLGKPVWDNPDTRVPTPNGVVAPATGQTTGY
jgi:phage tail tape-measure protein